MIDISLLEKDFKDLYTVLTLIEHQKGISSSSLKTLYYLFNHSDLTVRQFVIIVASKKIADKCVKKTQLKQLECLLLIGLSDKHTKSDALEGLANFANNNLVYFFGGILLNDSNELVRVQAAENLSISKNKAAIPFLEKSLNDKSYLVKSYGAYGLGLLHSVESVDILTKLQNRCKHVQVKAACSGALFLLTRDNIWLDKLLTALSDEDYHVPMNVIIYIEDAIEKGLISFDDVSRTVWQSLKRQKNKPTCLRIEQFLKRHTM